MSDSYSYMAFELYNYRPVEDVKYDALLCSNQIGYAPLGSLVWYLKMRDQKTFRRVEEMASQEVLIAGVRFKNSETHLRGFVLSSGERSKGYARFVRDSYSRPYRDFYYVMHFLAYELADKHISARHLGVTHLTGGGRNPYYGSVAKCALEAFIHYHEKFPSSVLAATFTGCCLREGHFSDLGEFRGKIAHEGHVEIEKKRKWSRIKTC